MDGLTNGYELGDPDCMWKTGDAPARTKNITHPGFCDPIDSAACQARENFTCGDTGYECPYFKNETGKMIKYISLHLKCTSSSIMVAFLIRVVVKANNSI